MKNPRSIQKSKIKNQKIKNFLPLNTPFPLLIRLYYKQRLVFSFLRFLVEPGANPNINMSRRAPILNIGYEKDYRNTTAVGY